MEQNRKDKDHKDQDRIIIRKIRPKYKKILIPFLIISLIVAIILIWLTNKYFFKPIFEGRGSIHQDRRILAIQSTPGAEKTTPYGITDRKG
jgi:Na+/citrate or Na+/malate symporter